MAAKRACFCDRGPNVMGSEASPGVGSSQASTLSGIKKTA
jgi:hypothetical protein